MTGIADIRLSGPILTKRYHVFCQLVDPDVMTRAYPTTRITDRLDSPLIGDFNVRYILQSRLAPAGTFRTNRDETRRDTMLSPSLTRFPVVFRTPWVEVRRNVPFVNPRAHFARSVGRVASFQNAIDAVASDPSWPPRPAAVQRESPSARRWAGGSATPG